MPESPCPPDAIAENVPVNANCLAAVELVTDLDGALSLSAARQDLGWVEIVSHVSNELLFLPVHDVSVVPVAQLSPVGTKGIESGRAVSVWPTL
jgi:hypothetical protein